jgi:hypothetical protein
MAVDWDDQRKSHKIKPCKECRAGMMTITTEERQSDGTWKVTKIVRNCGHVQEDDPK